MKKGSYGDGSLQQQFCQPLEKQADTREARELWQTVEPQT